MKHECPIKEWKGYVVVADYIDPSDFNNWYQLVTSEDYENDPSHPLLKIFPARSFLIKEFALNGVEFDGTAKSIPDMRILSWLSSITQGVINDAVSFLALPDSATDT